MIELRPAAIDDLPVIRKIYNHAILNTVATFDIEMKSDEEMLLWFEKHGERYPVVVCSFGGGGGRICITQRIFTEEGVRSHR